MLLCLTEKQILDKIIIILAYGRSRNLLDKESKTVEWKDSLQKGYALRPEDSVNEEINSLLLNVL